MQNREYLHYYYNKKEINDLIVKYTDYDSIIKQEGREHLAKKRVKARSPHQLEYYKNVDINDNYRAQQDSKFDLPQFGV